MVTEEQMAEWDALARRHQQRQVIKVTETQIALSRLWDETLDPRDITRSYARFQARAVPLIMAGRGISKNEAQAYFETLHGVSGLDSDLAKVYSPNFRKTDSIRSFNNASGKALARAEATAAKGLENAAVMEVAKRAMLAAAKRQVLQAGREHTIALTRTSGYGRWARVSDGSPCAFCRMLVSRGAVYTAGTVAFQAHNGCGCSVRPVRADEPSRTPQAREFKEQYDRYGLAALRQVLDDRKRAEGLTLAA